MKARQVRIAVYGGANCNPEIYDMARRVGQLLAERGVVVYCGGRTGVMEAVSRGVGESGGTVVGILPGNDCGKANEFISIPVATGVGKGRNVIIANSIQAAIAINGEYGTLSEIAYTLGQGKAVVGLGTWDIPGVTHVDTPEAAVEKALSLV